MAAIKRTNIRIKECRMSWLLPVMIVTVIDFQWKIEWKEKDEL